MRMKIIVKELLSDGTIWVSEPIDCRDLREAKQNVTAHHVPLARWIEKPMGEFIYGLRKAKQGQPGTVDEMNYSKDLPMSSADHLYVEKNEARNAFDSESALLESLTEKRDKLLAQIEECKKRRTEAGNRYERACVAVDEHESKNKF